MKVENNSLSGRPVQKSGNNGQATASSAAKNSTSSAPAISGEGNDTVNLTSFATNLQALASEVAKLPVADAQMVSTVQIAVANGTYGFEPIKAADNLITQEKELAQLSVHE